jgi:hypothetical protein
MAASLGMVYLKEAELRLLPPSISHPFCPVIFAESGRMPSSKGKAKDCFVVVTFAGLYLVRPDNIAGAMSMRAATHYKISTFFSIILITRIVKEGKKRVISSKARSTWVMCDHADEAAACLLTAYKVVYYKIPDAPSLHMEGFPTQIHSIRIADLVSLHNIAQVRSVVYSARYSVAPCEPLLDLLGNLEPGRSKTLLLDDSIGVIGNLRCLSVPVIQMGSLAVVHFRRMAPFLVCRLVREFLKQSTTIRSFIFEGYQYLVPAQLGMATLTLHGATPLSFIFRDCNLPDNVFCQLMTELTSTVADVQRLSFNGVRLSKQGCKHFFKSILGSRGFRTLEVLEFDRVTTEGLPAKTVNRGLARVVERCRFLRMLSISYFTPQVSVSLGRMMNGNTLHEIVLLEQDFTEPFSDFAVPAQTFLLDLSRSRFTASSLLSFLKVMSTVSSPLCLHLHDLRLTDDGWLGFFQGLKGHPKIPQLRELDWSGNRLPQSAMEAFTNYFFSSNTIHYFAIDRIFGPGTINELSGLFNALPQGQLWGVSIAGSERLNFSGHFRFLLQVMRVVKDLRILRLDGQKATDDDCALLLKFLYSHPRVIELSIDDTKISAPDVFFDFYHQIFVDTEIKGLGRPNIDIPRLFHGAAPTDSIPFEAFRLDMHRRPSATYRSIRAYYFCAHNPTGALETKDFYGVALSYPRCLLIGHVADPFFLNPLATGKELVSLASFKRPGVFQGLSHLHCGILPNPYELPAFPPPPLVAGPAYIRGDVLPEPEPAPPTKQVGMPKRQRTRPPPKPHQVDPEPVPEPPKEAKKSRHGKPKQDAPPELPAFLAPPVASDTTGVGPVPWEGPSVITVGPPVTNTGPPIISVEPQASRVAAPSKPPQKGIFAGDDSDEALTAQPEDAPFALQAPPPPSDQGCASPGRAIGYYQSFGEGLTINLDLPIPPDSSPLPPNEAPPEPKPSPSPKKGGAILYYRSLGEGLTITLDVPTVPDQSPLPPSDDQGRDGDGDYYDAEYYEEEYQADDQGGDEYQGDEYQGDGYQGDDYQDDQQYQGGKQYYPGQGQYIQQGTGAGGQGRRPA